MPFCDWAIPFWVGQRPIISFLLPVKTPVGLAEVSAIGCSCACQNKQASKAKKEKKAFHIEGTDRRML